MGGYLLPSHAEFSHPRSLHTRLPLSTRELGGLYVNVGFCPKCPFHGCPLSLLTSKASKGLVREPGPGTVLSTRQPPLRCLLSWKPTRRDCNQGPPPALSGFDGFGQGEALAGHQRWGGDRGDSEAFLLPPCSPWSSRQWPRFVVAAPAGWPLSWTPAATGDHRVPSPRLLQWRSARRASSWAAAVVRPHTSYQLSLPHTLW